MYEGTRVSNPFVFKRKEKSYLRNVKASHTLPHRICADKDTVIPTRTISPGIEGTNTLASHAANSGDIARRKECGNSGRAHTNLPAKFWKLRRGRRGRARCRLRVRIGMTLVIYKFLDEIDEVGLVNLACNNIRVDSFSYIVT